MFTRTAPNILDTDGNAVSRLDLIRIVASHDQPDGATYDQAHMAAQALGFDTIVEARTTLLQQQQL